MGIVNVTPDSFSDGGLCADTEAAIAHADLLIKQGADIVDIGGESTRPGSQPTDEPTELQRVIPVVAEVATRGTEVSIDTTKAAVARAAIDAGATIINDVSASLFGVAAESGAGWIAMHRQGNSATMQDDPRYHDVVEEVAGFLSEALHCGRAAGVERIWVDPGIGFGKTAQHNLELLANIDRFTSIAPVLLGVSRKSVIGHIHARSDGVAGENPTVATDDRLVGSLAIALWSAYLGVDMIRVHDVKATVDALSLLKA